MSLEAGSPKRISLQQPSILG
jgi:hypothetical protein